MAIVTVKNKYQVVIPQHVRDEIGASVGELIRTPSVFFHLMAFLDISPNGAPGVPS
jgi:hypothetical protein